jgi:hypothetical protein
VTVPVVKVGEVGVFMLERFVTMPMGVTTRHGE